MVSIAGPKHRRRSAAWHSPLGVGHENAKPLDAVPKVQERCHLLEPEIAVRKGSRRRNYNYSVHSILLGHLISPIPYSYK